MYCPHCGTQNEPNKSYCRHCGQSLRSVQLVLDGRVDEATAKFGKAEDLLAAGLVTFAIFMLTSLIFLALGAPVPFAINVVLGFAICVPIVITGLVRVDRVRRMLDPKVEKEQLPPAHSAIAELPAARATDPLDSRVPISSSVTEHTTLNLKTREPKH